MYKKGQASMEFLMTYGWAILVVLVAIGALAYFGVLSPGKFLPESCVIAPGYSCNDFIVKADGSATLIIQNGAKATLNTISASIGAVSGTCVPATGLAVGSATTCSWAAAALATGTAGERFKSAVSFSYIEAGSTISHTKTGDLVVKYE
jgi:hypothetical protein